MAHLLCHARRGYSLSPCVALMWVLLAASGYAQNAGRDAGNEAPRGDANQKQLVVRILTYNIHHGAGVDGKIDLPRLAKVIKAEQPDIVAVQEVDQNVKRSGVVDQPAELSRLTGLAYRFGPNIDLQNGEYGNTVLTNFPIVSVQNHLLPRHRNGEQRGALVVRVSLPSSAPDAGPSSSGAKRELIFIATHLDHRRDESERLASVAQINEIASDVDLPLILAGDLNATRDSRVLNRLIAAGWQIAGPELPTVPVTVPTRQIDFVLYRPGNVWTVAETKVLPEATASDHRALLVTLRLRSPK